MHASDCTAWNRSPETEHLHREADSAHGCGCGCGCGSNLHGDEHSSHQTAHPTSDPRRVHRRARGRDHRRAQQQPHQYGGQARPGPTASTSTWRLFTRQSSLTAMHLPLNTQDPAAARSSTEPPVGTPAASMRSRSPPPQTPGPPDRTTPGGTPSFRGPDVPARHRHQDRRPHPHRRR